MKRYIKSSSSDKLQLQQAAIKQDIRTLSKADSIDDVLSAGFQSINVKHVVDVFRQKYPDQEDDFDAFSDFAYDWLLDTRDWVKNEMSKTADAEKAAHDAATLIKTTFGSVITDVEEDDRYMYISVNDPYVETRDQLFQFVDDVKETIDGNYNGTGRGGSWTAWDLISDKGTSVKVGIPDTMMQKHIDPESNLFIAIRMY